MFSVDFLCLQWICFCKPSASANTCSTPKGRKMETKAHHPRNRNVKCRCRRVWDKQHSFTVSPYLSSLFSHYANHKQAKTLWQNQQLGTISKQSVLRNSQSPDRDQAEDLCFLFLHMKLRSHLKLCLCLESCSEKIPALKWWLECTAATCEFKYFKSSIDAYLDKQKCPQPSLGSIKSYLPANPPLCGFCSPAMPWKGQQHVPCSKLMLPFL